MTNIIEQLDAEQMQGKNIPSFNAGDTVSVQVKVKEGDRERLQTFEGVVIAKRNRGINSAFTVRKISNGEGVERVFQTYSPMIASITVKRHGDVRRAKLYYLRERSGRSARIKEKLGVKAAKMLEQPAPKVEAPVEQAAPQAKAAEAKAPEAKAKAPEKKAEATKKEEAKTKDTPPETKE